MHPLHGPHHGRASSPTAIDHPLSGENEARRFWLELLFPGGRRWCPRCLDDKTYLLRDQRLRCGGCQYTFSPFRSRFLGTMNLSALEWLTVCEAFARGETAKDIAGVAGRSYKTIYSALGTIRAALMASHPGLAGLVDAGGDMAATCCKGQTDLSEGPLHLCGSPVFRLWSEDGQVRVVHEPRLNSWGMLVSPSGKTRWRNFFCTVDASTKTMLLSCCYKTIRSRLFVDAAADQFAHPLLKGFFDYFKDAIGKYRCFSPEKAGLYLAELVTRYNHWGEDLTERFARVLAEPLPGAPRPAPGA